MIIAEAISWPDVALAAVLVLGLVAVALIVNR